MNWKIKQKMRAEQRKRMGRVDIVPVAQPVKVRKVINPKRVGLVGNMIQQFLPKAMQAQTFDHIQGCWAPRKKGVFGSAQGFIDALHKRGYKYLGSGAYSTVLAKDGSDRVIKVQRGNDNWIDYIKWASERGYMGNLAPKVYSFKRLDNFAVAIVERMDRTTNDDKDDLSLMDRLIAPASRGNMMAKLFMEELSPNCTPFFDGLYKDFAGHLDLYGKNIMIRPNGTLCVTDPVCGTSKMGTVKRLRTGDLSPAPTPSWIYFID